MKMEKKNRIFLCIIISLFLLGACQKGTEEPTIQFSNGSVQLTPIYYGDRFNEDEAQIEEKIQYFMIGKLFVELPNVIYGEQIQIQAQNFSTKNYEVYDYLLDGKGNIISEYEMTPTLVKVMEQGMTTFTFEPSHNAKVYADYAIDHQLAHCILIRSKIYKSNFAFATLILSEEEI
ncbi:hypothetical protein PB01_15685 [Psychrobacillus glaciei]|uniref:Uncharacterized protein n=1 Tax=Psychrobacillus glaciei TaxID=2283160 RepID=A0A5J6SRF0_9BACI|nr:hypothetical protein [Psychrobacillus glaciei]QFG00153.1 hypothetical protein PB01_15685 [Psychrobacillus glaciei]